MQDTKQCVSDMCSYPIMKLFVLLFWLGFLNELECIQCPEHCKSCSSTTNCLQCNPGYKGNTCEEKCSNCKEGTKCKQDTGYCEESCKVGKSGDSCDIDCSSSCMSCERYDRNNCTTCAHDRYGRACYNKCPSKCRNSTCNEMDGICTDGCATGFWGPTCENPCSEHCNDCDRNGTCLKCANGYGSAECIIEQNQSPNIYGLVFGVLGLLALLVIVAIICIKRQKLIRCLHSTWNRILECTNQGNTENDENDYEVMEPINYTSSRAPVHSQISNITVGEEVTVKLLKSSHETQEASNGSTPRNRINGHRDTENLDSHNQDENLRRNRPTGNTENDENDYEVMEPINYTSSRAPVHSQMSNTTVGEEVAVKLLESSHETQEASNGSTPRYKINGHRDTENLDSHNQDENLRTNRPTDDDSQTAANNYKTDSNVIKSLDIYIKGMDGKCDEYFASCGSFEVLITDGLLWKKVWQTMCSVIVMLTTREEAEAFRVYVSTCAKQKQAEFTITYNGQKVGDQHSYVRHLILCKHESDKKTETLNIVLSVFYWPTDLNPLHKERFSNWHKRTTDERKKLKDCGLSIVFSSDRVNRCGTYIAFDMWKREHTTVTTESINNYIVHLKSYGVEINNENELRQLFIAEQTSSQFNKTDS